MCAYGLLPPVEVWTPVRISLCSAWVGNESGFHRQMRFFQAVPHEAMCREHSCHSFNVCNHLVHCQIEVQTAGTQRIETEGSMHLLLCYPCSQHAGLLCTKVISGGESQAAPTAIGHSTHRNPNAVIHSTHACTLCRFISQTPICLPTPLGASWNQLPAHESNSNKVHGVCTCSVVCASTADKGCKISASMTACYSAAAVPA